MNTHDLKSALRLVWLGVTLATATALLVPFLVPADRLARSIPACDSRRLYGRPCFLCGTTTGFIAIANGDWSAASRSNALAIPLFAAFSANAAVAVAYLYARARARLR